MQQRMMVLSNTQLDRLEAAWRRAGAEIVDHLRPGLSRDEMLSAAAERPELHLSEDALRWWGWHDGADGPWAHLGGTRDFPSFADSLELYDDSYRDYDPGLFPLAGGDDPLVLDCTTPGTETSEVITVPHGSPWKSTGSTLSQVVEHWTAFIKDGVWIYGPNGHFEINDADFSANDWRFLLT